MKITLEFEFDKYDFENAVEIYSHQYNFSLDELSRNNAVYVHWNSQLTSVPVWYLCPAPGIHSAQTDGRNTGHHFLSQDAVKDMPAHSRRSYHHPWLRQ